MEKNNLTTSFEVKLSNYSGPLEVLYELIKKRKLEIGATKLLDIIEQYNDFLQKAINDLPIEEFADYLLMNAELLKIKTKALLEEEQDLSTIEFKEDDLLTKIEYQKYKGSVHFFQKLFDKRLTMVDKDPEDYDDYALKDIPVAKLPKLINVEKLQVYFQNIVDNIIEKSYEESDELFREKVEFNQYSIKKIQKEIINYLEKQLNKKDTFLNCFLNNVDKNFTKAFYSAFFLAILTLIRHSIITISEYETESYIVQLEDDIDTRLTDLINEE